MSKQINIGGRLHSTEQGNVITGANEVLDDTKGKKQNVINSETDAELLRLDQSKQDNLTFDNTPTENSTNPVTSGGVYAANITLHELIEAILVLIPSAASALNQLADKTFVNSSVSTATATFRGTYNVVTDLELAYDATHEQIATKLGQVIATADNNDYAFVQIPVSATSTDIRRTERYKFNGTVWGYEYDLNTSGFTAVQWEAINSAITAALVQKLAALPTAQELAAALLGKQDVLTFDNVPTTDSSNPVKSGGVKSAINDEKAARENADMALSGAIGDEEIRAKGVERGLNDAIGLNGQAIGAIQNVIPNAATSSNKLVDNTTMTSTINAIIGQMDATFNLTTTDGHITLHVTQENGVITSVQIQSSDIASAAALTLVMNRVSTAENNITSLTGRVSTNETDIANLQQLYNNLQQSKPVPVTALPETGQQQGVIYRLAGTTSYSDYMWNGSTWVLMATYNNAIDEVPVYGSHNLVESGGVKSELTKVDAKFGVEIQETKALDTTTTNQFILTAEEGHANYLTGKVVFTVDSLDIEHIVNIMFGYGDLNFSPGSMQYVNTGSVNNNKFKTGFSVVLFDDPTKRLEGIWVTSSQVPSNCTLNCTITANGVDQRITSLENVEKVITGNKISKKDFNVTTNERYNFLMTEGETYPLNLCGRVHLRIDDMSIDNIPNGGTAIAFGFKDLTTGQMTYLNLGSNNNGGAVVDKFDWLLFDNINYQLSGVWIDTNYVPSDFTLSFTVYSEGTYIGNKQLMTYIPRFVPLFQDNNIPFTATRDNIRIYPHNLIDVDDTDYSVGVCCIGQRSGEKIVVPHVADTKFPVDIINFDGKVCRAGYINTIIANPSAPANELFILTIGDSLMLGANMPYHGCINNELSRLFNGIGKAIANGAEPLGYTNIHIIGTLDSNYGSVTDAPIKHEGRGGWTVGMYLTTQANNAFYNPNKQGDVKFDLDYYLSQNGFYTQGVAQDGSNLIIPIMLNWNSDPEQDSYIDNYRLLIEDIHTSHPNARIMLVGCNCPPREILATYNDVYLQRYSQLQAITKRRTILYEKKLESLADEYSYCIHVPIMPFYNWQNSFSYFDNVLPTPRDPSNVLRLYADYVHPNLIGYGQISDILFNAICFWYLT